MPGILPMKVIKMGTSAQTRIAQACDRCRSKKIRCDGQRPTCSQCATVGFECKTSDKLSRRAFPRGYTESLEERVRVLEAEVRELKELLDEKDEKLDMLSRLHSPASRTSQNRTPRRISSASVQSQSSDGDTTFEKDDMFKVQPSPKPVSSDGPISCSDGISTASNFVQSFKRKAHEQGRVTDNIDIEKLTPNQQSTAHFASFSPKAAADLKAPPRLLSDKLINVFLQEWAPLFPVLHRPTFLALYERYAADADAVTDNADIAQLNLVFGIAELSSPSKTSENLQIFEGQWTTAMTCVISDTTLKTLQALILAQIYCVQKGDTTRLSMYKGLATALSARLGLHRSQIQFGFDALECETRKKLFWTLYTIDCFTAVTLGLPKHLNEGDIQCEYPIDVDDEYISEHDQNTTPSSESTRLSSALALFQSARILSKVVSEVFPAKTTYELSLKRLSELLGELDSWNSSLASHLRLQFANDKPSTGTISSRSPLLSLVYHYIRALIQRPVVCAAPGRRSSSFVLALASSSKHMIQILQLLNERGLSFTFCGNRDELIVQSSFGLMFQCLDLEQSSKILKDNQRMLLAGDTILAKSGSRSLLAFRKAISMFGATRGQTDTQMSDRPSLSRLPSGASDAKNDDETTTGGTSSPIGRKKQLKAIAAGVTSTNMTKKAVPEKFDHRRATVHNVNVHPNEPASQSRSPMLWKGANNYDTMTTSRSEPARSPAGILSRPNSVISPASAPPQPAQSVQQKPKLSRPQYLTNLDYLSFGDSETSAAQPVPIMKSRTQSDHGPSDWEKLLGSLDNGTTNIYDATYGGQPVDVFLDVRPLNGTTGLMTQQNDSNVAIDIPWDSEPWMLCSAETNTSAHSAFTTASSGLAGSVLSLSSDEGNHSNEDFTSSDWISKPAAKYLPPKAVEELCGAIVMPEMGLGDDLGFGPGWSAALNL